MSIKYVYIKILHIFANCKCYLQFAKIKLTNAYLKMGVMISRQIFVIGKDGYCSRNSVYASLTGMFSPGKLIPVPFA